MPRSAGGTYTLAAGNPVVPNTVIDTVWCNPTMADLATAMTDSLSRTGLGGMLVAFKNADGTMAAPGMTWTNDTASGWYRKTSGQFWYSVSGVDIFGITTAGITLAAGKSATGIVAPITVQDALPSGMVQGSPWWDSDSGAYLMNYVNPDLTVTLVALGQTGGDFFPFAGLNTLLGDYADDAAAAVGGVAVGAAYRTGSFMKARIA